MNLKLTIRFVFFTFFQSADDSKVTLAKQHGLRAAFVKVLQQKFADYDLTYSIGGKISFDIFPHGWDKTYCLRHVEDEHFEEIHFFGDKTYKVRHKPSDSVFF